MKNKASLYLAILVGLFLLLPWTVAAQDDEADPPSRVARLNHIDGSISFQPAGEQDWVQANPNRPLTTGDNLWADQNSRGELHIGSTALRISSQTGISFLNLNDQQIQIQLAQGTLNVRVRELDENEAYEVDTPNLAFSILRTGEYRFDVDPNGGSTVITVFTGQGEVTGGGRTYSVTPGQRATFTGTDQLEYDVQRGPGQDQFDAWVRSRDDREEHSESARYVSRDVTGYDDLDTYGHWRPVSEYGQVWVPNNVAADWAPYHDGHWAFIAPWGWTWVDDEPWGFAPFHYGRWAFIDGYWGWVPGPVAVVGVRAVYAPALVGFVGGGGFGVAVGFGGGVGVGWFPLGPRDVFIPAYRVSARYAEVINVSNSRVIERTTVVNVYNNVTVNHVTNVNYTYQANTRAVTAVSRETFVNARPVAAASIKISAQEIQRPQVVQNVALTPTRTSVVGPSAAARVTPPAALANRRMVTKMTPAPTAAPIGKPRPATNPNLAPARVNAATNGNAAGNTARPGNGAQPAARPGNQPTNQPAERTSTPPNRENPNANPARPSTPPSRENPNANPETRPSAPPNRENPNANPNPANRPFTPPNRENPNPSEKPAEQPKTAQPARPEPQAQPERTVPPPRTEQRPQPQAQPERTPPPPRTEQRPQPQAQPERTPPPPRTEQRPQPQAQPERTPPPPRTEQRPQPQPEQKPRATPPPEKKEQPPAKKAPKDEKEKPPRS